MPAEAQTNMFVTNSPIYLTISIIPIMSILSTEKMQMGAKKGF